MEKITEKLPREFLDEMQKTLGEDYQKMIEFVAKGFKVDKKSVCNLPIDILTRMAEQLGWNGSSNSPKGKEPGDE